MKEEYDFSNAERGRFYRPDTVCNGALIGIGLQGRIAFNFNREEDSALSAVCSAIKNIRNVLPDATLMGASPAMFAAYAFDTYNDQ